MNIEEVIQVELDLKAKDYVRILLWYQWKKLAMVLIACLFGVLIFAWVLIAGGSETTKEDTNLTVITIVVTVVVLLPIIIISVYLGILRQAKKLEKISEPGIFYFSNIGLESRTSSASSQMNWDRFAKVCETKSDFIFFPQHNIYYPVPKRFFTDESQVIALRKLLADNLGTKAYLKD